MGGAERSVHDAEEPSAVPAGVPTAHRRARAEGAYARRTRTPVRTLGPGDSKLGSAGRPSCRALISPVTGIAMAISPSGVGRAPHDALRGRSSRSPPFACTPSVLSQALCSTWYKTAVVAVAHRRCRVLCALLRDGTDFQPSRLGLEEGPFTQTITRRFRLTPKSGRRLAIV